MNVTRSLNSFLLIGRENWHRRYPRALAGPSAGVQTIEADLHRSRIAESFNVEPAFVRGWPHFFCPSHLGELTPDANRRAIH